MVAVIGDLALARHLEIALHTHRARVERDGGAVPDALCLIERLARFRVTGGQGGSGFGVPAARLDAQGMTPQLLTYRQAADVLASSESTVKRLISRGDLPAVRIGGAARVRVADLDAYVAGLGTRIDPATDDRRPQ